MEESKLTVFFKSPGSVKLHLRMTTLPSRGMYSELFQILVINLIFKRKIRNTV